ncbi:hypothetical protein CLOP_g21561 [Closterium sp. NIES-67]|nr:hypothetical protein CLOP_g21561 [Closterium sp. NIES-67]
MEWSSDSDDESGMSGFGPIGPGGVGSSISKDGVAPAGDGSSESDGARLLPSFLRGVSDESRRAIEALMAAKPCGLIVSDALEPEHPIIYVNSVFERLTGYTAEDILGRNCRFLQYRGAFAQRPHALVNPATVARLRQCVAEGREFCGEILNFRKDGSAIMNTLCLAPIRGGDTNAVTHFVGVQSFAETNVELGPLPGPPHKELQHLPMSGAAASAAAAAAAAVVAARWPPSRQPGLLSDRSPVSPIVGPCSRADPSEPSPVPGPSTSGTAPGSSSSSAWPACCLSDHPPFPGFGRKCPREGGGSRGCMGPGRNYPSSYPSSSGGGSGSGLLQLSDEVLVQRVMCHLGPRDIASLAMACRRFKKLAVSQDVWQRACQHLWGAEATAAVQAQATVGWKSEEEEAAEEVIRRGRYAWHGKSKVVFEGAVGKEGGLEGERGKKACAGSGQQQRQLIENHQKSQWLQRVKWGQIARELTTLEAATWRKVTVKGSVEPSRCNFSACAVGSKVVLFGGEGANMQPLNDTFVLDLASDIPEWRHVPVAGSAPPGRWGHTLSCVNGSGLVVFGGCGREGLLNDAFLLDLDDKQPKWREVLVGEQAGSSSAGGGARAGEGGDGGDGGAGRVSTGDGSDVGEGLLLRSGGDGRTAAESAGDGEIVFRQGQGEGATQQQSDTRQDYQQQDSRQQHQQQQQQQRQPHQHQQQHLQPLSQPPPPPTPPQRPHPRSWHSSCTVEGSKLVVSGGCTASGRLLSDTFLLDLAHNPPSWKEIRVAWAPPARLGHTLSALGGRKVLMFGGLATSGALRLRSNDAFIIDLADEHPNWRTVSPDAPLPGAGGGANGSGAGGGGGTGGTPGGASPPPRLDHVAFALPGGRVLVFGGSIAGVSPTPSQVYLLDPGEEKPRWRELAFPGQQPRIAWGHSTCVVGGTRAVVLGGQTGKEWVLNELHELSLLSPAAMAPPARCRGVEDGGENGGAAGHEGNAEAGGVGEMQKREGSSREGGGVEGARVEEGASEEGVVVAQGHVASASNPG